MKRFLLIVFLTFGCAFTFAQKAGVVASEVDSLAAGVIRDYQARMNIIADKFVDSDSTIRIALVGQYNELSRECNVKVFDIYAKHIDKGEYYRQMVFNLRTMVDKDKVGSVIKRIKGKDKKESPYGIALAQFVDNKQVEIGDNYIDFSATTVRGDEFQLSDIVDSKDVMLIFGVEVMDENSLAILKMLYAKADYSLLELVVFSTTALDANSLKEQVAAGNGAWVNVSDFRQDISPVVIGYDVVSLPTFVLIGKGGKIKFISQGMSQDVLVAFAK